MRRGAELSWISSFQCTVRFWKKTGVVSLDRIPTLYGRFVLCQQLGPSTSPESE